MKRLFTFQGSGRFFAAMLAAAALTTAVGVSNASQIAGNNNGVITTTPVQGASRITSPSPPRKRASGASAPASSARKG